MCVENKCHHKSIVFMSGLRTIKIYTLLIFRWIVFCRSTKLVSQLIVVCLVVTIYFNCCLFVISVDICSLWTYVSDFAIFQIYMSDVQTLNCDRNCDICDMLWKSQQHLLLLADNYNVQIIFWVVIFVNVCVCLMLNLLFLQISMKLYKKNAFADRTCDEKIIYKFRHIEHIFVFFAHAVLHVYRCIVMLDKPSKNSVTKLQCVLSYKWKCICTIK